jgi:hypothetical protein
MKTKRFEERLVKIGYGLIATIFIIVTYSIIFHGVISTSSREF